MKSVSISLSMVRDGVRVRLMVRDGVRVKDAIMVRDGVMVCMSSCR